MLTILMGRAKTGKSDTVLRRIAELGDSGRQILLVPEHASHQAEVDLCRACGPTASRHAEVLSFRRLSDRVLAITGGIAQVTLDAGGKLLTLQKALTEVMPSLTVYRRPSQKSAFLQQLLALLDELRCYEVSPENLYAQAQNITGATHDKLCDLSLLYGAYEARLRRPGVDARDRMTKLCDSLEDSGYACGKDIFIDGFTYFNAQERRALSVLLRQARSVTVTLLGEPNSREEIFEASLKTLGQLRRVAEQERCPVEIQVLKRRDNTVLGHVERYFFGENVPFEGDSGAICIREADNVFSEVEQTAADILRLVAAGKCRYRDITVAARNMGDYEGVIETVFERYGIPAYLSRRSDILEKPVLSLLTGVLAAVGNGYEYEDMFRWLKTGLAGLTAAECDELENYVLKWEIHGQMWLRDVDWTENPEGYGEPWNGERQARLERINELRRRVRQPLLALAEGLKTGETAREKVNSLYSFMETLGLQNALESQMKAQAEAGRLQDAEETAQLWEILCGVLDQFVEILGDEPMSLDEFTRLFRQVVTQYSVGTIPVSLDQVSVSEITRNDRHTDKHLFLLGANDHVLPDPGQSGGILNDDDRDALAQRGIELAPTGMDRMSIELQNLYAALAQPTDGLTVSYPVSDVSGAELRPAFVIGRLLSLFPAIKVEKESNDKEYRLTAAIPALEAAGQQPQGALWRYFAEEPRFTERLAAMERAASIKRGSLSRSAVRALYGDRVSMSASRLERMRSCHFAYFMEYGLKAKPRTPAAFDAPQIGTFLHYLLENVLRELDGGEGIGQAQPERLRALVNRFTDQYIAAVIDGYGDKSARFRYLFSRLRETACTIVENAVEEMRHSDFRPMAFELGFGGRDGQLPAITVTAGDTTLSVTGKVDRVDGWLKDGRLYLRVVDYKTGKKSFDLADVRCGLGIQMLLYLFALQRSGAAYFNSPVEPAGVLYLPARDVILRADRAVPPEKLQASLRRELRRSGMILAEPDVLTAMEHEALESPCFLPLGVAKDGTLTGSLASAVQLGKLGRYVDKLLHRVAEELGAGNIDADPCVRGPQESACDHCAFASACWFDERRDKAQYLQKTTPEEFWAAVDREVSHG